ncbi:MAG: lamin tail domain-containing protein, partial [Bacteroidia bacterium]
MYGQFTDNFEDLNFTANPVWSGDVTKWEVLDTLTSKRLHLERLPAAADSAYLSTPSAAICNGVWEFDIRLRYNQSSANFARVFLTADRANLFDPGVKGYQLVIGRPDGTIGLYRVNGTSWVPVCTSTTVVVSPAIWVRIKVTRTGAGVWNVYADNTTANGSSYVLLATGTDATYDNSTHCGVATRFSATRNQWALFDNFSVTGTACPDTTKPTVVSVVPTSINTATVTFSEKIGLATAQNPANYVFNNGAFAASSATVMVGDTTKILLGLTPNQFNNCGADSVRIANVQDIAGNAMLPDTLASTYFVAGNAVWKSVVISEIMADPSPAPACIPAFEFIEIYNRGTFPVDLNGWTIKDITGSPLVITNTSHPFCPGEYRILCAPGANFTGYGNVIHVTGMSSTMLNNTGDNLGLRSGTGTSIDSVEYVDTWYQDGVKAQGGWTLELINPTDTCATASNWIASNDACGGTPGAQNSVYSTLPDLTAPSIVSATVMGAANLLVCFDESLVPGVASNPGFYSVNGGMPAPTTAIPAPPDYRCVTLLFPVPFDTGTVYTVTANGVTDCHGNSAPSSTTFMISGPANPSDVIINEIFFDPDTSATNLPNVEYVELYNRSIDAFDLSGWKFRDTGSPLTLGNYILLPGAYVILCEEADTAFYSGLPYLGMPTWPSLNNTGDNLGLHDG